MGTLTESVRNCNGDSGKINSDDSLSGPFRDLFLEVENMDVLIGHDMLESSQMVFQVVDIDVN